MKQRRIVLVVHNVRSAHNVGSLLRTADGLGVDKVYLCGYTPYPETPDDERLPHLRLKVTKQISKTALGAENNLSCSHETDVFKLLDLLKKQGFLLAALEQAPKSELLENYHSDRDIALLVGNEVEGLDKEVLEQTEVGLEIPMLGKKESLNVTIAAAIALHHLRYFA